MTTCPKCGFEQEGGAECLSCGVIFARYRPEPPRPAPARPAAPVAEREGPGAIVRFYRVFRWVVLAALLLVVLLVTKKAPPPSVSSDPEAPQRLEAKLRAAELAAQAGQPHTLALDEAEINSWLGSHLQMAREPGSEPQSSPPEAEPTLEEVQSSVRDVKVDLVGDRVRAYVLFDYHGKDLTLLLEGRLRAENGYLRFEPTGGKLGELPLPQAALDRATTRLFNDPENREKLRLPPEVRDVRIENGELKVSYR